MQDLLKICLSLSGLFRIIIQSFHYLFNEHFNTSKMSLIGASDVVND